MFVDDMILCIEDLKDNKTGTVERFRITQKWVLLLYTGDEQSTKEIKKTIPFVIIWKEYLRVNLIKEV